MATYYRITKDFALKEIRRFAIAYPTSPPEIAAIGLMRRIDDWAEHTAILAALDEILRGGGPVSAVGCKNPDEYFAQQTT